MIGNGRFLHVVGNEEWGGPADELDEVKDVNGDGVVSGRIGKVEQVDDGGGGLLFMDAGENAKLSAGFAMYYVSSLVSCIFP